MSSYHSTPSKGKLRRLFDSNIVRLSVFFIVFMWTLPTAGMLVSSFRTPLDIRTSGWWTVFLPPYSLSQWTLENYQNVILADGMGPAFINSIIVTVPATVIPITIAAFAAYAFAWMQFRGRDALFALVVAMLVVPLQMALIPVLRLYTSLELNGTFSPRRRAGMSLLTPPTTSPPRRRATSCRVMP